MRTGVTRWRRGGWRSLRQAEALRDGELIRKVYLGGEAHAVS
jgi:hypothetical protein